MARTHLFSYLVRLLKQANINKPSGLFTIYKRRKFLKNIALTGGGLITSLALSNYSKTYGKNSPSIAIIGGGIAGLNAAYQLKKVGLIANVYEGKERLGGRVHSIKIGAKKTLF
ncbi:NAD(P)-binding protein [Aphanothece sacrum]|uniref:NAD(P)-binding protein n=1 Tax=Aphanothece sacrum TaxID=1122 RepID=UPI000FF90ACB|nr:NAD(P)-binding protein [Aphanothece sacrum]GBF85651.1 tryptophan 2-monooxygenase [Aphanothece sacrum FPU3]